MSDLPTTPEGQLAMAATPARDDPRDVLLAARPFGELARGAVVGTTSARRLAMLRRLRPDLSYHLIDGDAQICMDMVADGQLAAVVCGRLDLGRRKAKVGQVFAIEQLLPDPGQGALVLECLNDRYDVIDTVRVLHDLRTWRAITAERALLAALNPEGRFVVGGYAADDGHLVSVTAAVLSRDGRRLARTFGTADSTEAADLGHRLGADLHAAVASWDLLAETGTGETT
ncbi:hydroxymethylbilane synthase [Nonomuraea sp. SYSU D8015]|uniref:hydroxymethylbilane synthase n=1 Tax=Nonomuraea sp. SYSU D8015 TaxID=2593644 RepID=UPI0021D2E0AB|nr:hydroxymethylbilane synthase [Nonomuraea sp. SYSU D8015]